MLISSLWHSRLGNETQPANFIIPSWQAAGTGLPSCNAQGPAGASSAPTNLLPQLLQSVCTEDFKKWPGKHSQAPWESPHSGAQHYLPVLLISISQPAANGCASDRRRRNKPLHNLALDALFPKGKRLKQAKLHSQAGPLPMQLSTLPRGHGCMDAAETDELPWLHSPV